MAQSFTVTDETTLNNAIAAINGSSGATAYTIVFANSITLNSGAIPTINLASGATLTINGAEFTLDGINGTNGFFIGSGPVTIQNMTLSSAFAQLSSGSASLILQNTQFTGVQGNIFRINLFNGGVVDGSAVAAPNILFFNIFGSAPVTLIGGSGNDVFNLSSQLIGSDSITGGGGNDELLLQSPGTQDASAVRGVGFYNLHVSGSSQLTLADANFAGVAGDVIGVVDNSYNGASIVVDASAVSAPNSVYFIGGGGGHDTFKGGAGNDTFSFTAANLGSSDSVQGGGGNDELLLTTPGTINASGVSGIAFYQLANGAPDFLSLTNANFTGLAGTQLRVAGGDSGNTIDASQVSPSNGLLLAGGAGDDVFGFATLTSADTVTGGGGRDELLMTTPGAIDASGVSGVTFYQLQNGGPNSLTLTDANFAGVSGDLIGVGGGDSGDTIDASAVSAPNSVFLIGGAGTDTFKGGAGNDVFQFSATNLTFMDSVQGGGGRDELLMTTSGAIDASGVSGVTFYQLAEGAPNSLALSDANFAGVAGGLIGVATGNFGDTIDASQVSASHAVWFIGGGGGTDTFVGGAGDDVFQFSAASLTIADTIRGGGGHDELLMTTPGHIFAGGVSGVAFYQLANGGPNSVTLTNANFMGVAENEIGVGGGDSGNTIDGSQVSAGDMLYLIGGPGNDTLKGGAGTDVLITGGGTDTLSGGGANGVTYFVLTSAGGSTAVNFFHGLDFLVFQKAGFDLGIDDSQATGGYQQLDASVFSTSNNGAFTTIGQRFAYDQSSGQLLYAPNGSATPTGSVSIAATLTGSPTVTLTDLLFTS